MAVGQGTPVFNLWPQTGGPYSTGALSSFNHNPGSASYVLVAVALNNVTSTGGSRCTVEYNGVPMTFIDEGVNDALSTQPGVLLFYEDTGGWSGDQAVVVTLTDQNSNSVIACAMAVTGDTGTHGDSSGGTATTDAATRDVTTTAANSRVYGFFAWRDPADSSPLVASSGSTEIDQDNSADTDTNDGLSMIAVYEDVVSAGAATVGATAQLSHRHASVAVEILEDTGGGGGGTPQLYYAQMARR